VSIKHTTNVYNADLVGKESVVQTGANRYFIYPTLRLTVRYSTHIVPFWEACRSLPITDFTFTPGSSPKYLQKGKKLTVSINNRAHKCFPE
jgi:hypothetical protein